MVLGLIFESSGAHGLISQWVLGYIEALFADMQGV